MFDSIKFRGLQGSDFSLEDKEWQIAMMSRRDKGIFWGN